MSTWTGWPCTGSRSPRLRSSPAGTSSSNDANRMTCFDALGDMDGKPAEPRQNTRAFLADPRPTFKGKPMSTTNLQEVFGRRKEGFDADGGPSHLVRVSMSATASSGGKENHNETTDDDFNPAVDGLGRRRRDGSGPSRCREDRRRA